jgi:hypothetical protein
MRKFAQIFVAVITSCTCLTLIFTMGFDCLFNKQALAPIIISGEKISYVTIKKESNDPLLSDKLISNKVKITKIAEFFKSNNTGWRYHSLVPMPSHSYRIILTGDNYSLSIFFDSDGHLAVNDGDINGTKWKLLTRDQVRTFTTIVE